ncbi:hypothetical protein ACP70R_033362 [Stipagrostis hirtigluma subsp. patula]
MNYPDPLAGPWWSHPDNAGEAAAASDNSSSFAYMSGDYSTADLFELVWQGGGGAGGGGGGSLLDQPPVVSLCLSPRFNTPSPPAHVLRNPPSEDEMAAWLYSIVKGEEHGHDGGDLGPTAHGRYPPPKESSSTSMATRAASSSTHEREALAITEGVSSKDTGNDSSERQKMAGGARRSHHGEAHNLTEKRRRSKIKERLKTLQQLVPGCDKQSNHASTLDRTITYMKSLQQQVQAMSGGRPARPAAAIYPVVQPRSYVSPVAPVAVTPMVLGPAPTTVLPFGPMVPLHHYPTMMMPAAAAAPLYPTAAAPGVLAPSPGSHRHGCSSSRGKGSSSLRQKE